MKSVIAIIIVIALVVRVKEKISLLILDNFRYEDNLSSFTVNAYQKNLKLYL